MRKGEEPKAPRHASAAATRNGNLLLHDGSLPHVTATCLILDNNKKGDIILPSPINAEVYL